MEGGTAGDPEHRNRLVQQPAYNIVSPIPVMETFSLLSPISSASEFILSPQISLTEPPETIVLSTIPSVENVTFFFSPHVPNAPKDVIIPPIKVNAKVVKQPIMTTDILGRPNVLMAQDIFVPSMQLLTSQNPLVVPLIYGDSCNIENIKDDVSKMYYFKLLDKWMYENDKVKQVLKYLHVVDGKVKLIQSVEKVDDVKKNPQDIIDKKVDYIENNVLSQDEVRMILTRFVESTHISWCDLPKCGFLVRDAISKTLKNKLKRLIEQQ